jgi:cytochrome c biogenesis protein CcmG, thiol:disulfide interchange protein DsbE
MAGNRRKRHNQQQRNRTLSLVFIGAGLLLLGVMALVLLPKPGESAQSSEIRSAIPVEVNYPAPELSLNDLEGKPFSLEDYRGTVVLVNNWATWCPPCKAEMPTLQAYFEDYGDRGFTIIAIESGDSIPEVKKFVQDYGLTFPVWADTTMKAIAAFRNTGLPSSYVIDRDGTVRLAWAGAVSRDMLEKYVTPLLEE